MNLGFGNRKEMFFCEKKKMFISKGHIKVKSVCTCIQSDVSSVIIISQLKINHLSVMNMFAFWHILLWNKNGSKNIFLETFHHQNIHSLPLLQHNMKQDNMLSIDYYRAEQMHGLLSRIIVDITSNTWDNTNNSWHSFHAI